MRTTVSLDDDVVAAVAARRRRDGAGLSETINNLVREGLAARSDRHRYRHVAADLGLKIDVRNIADALELLDES